MATARRFVFFEDMKDGSQRLMLANLDRSRFRFAPSARIIAQMGTVPGNPPVDGNVPETYALIVCRPDNAYAAVWSAQVGIDFVDWNVGIYDMETGARTVRFNEHSLSDVNRANCPCPLFDTFLAAEAAIGVPQSQLDTYDYTVVVEGTGVGEPILTWSATGTLIADYGFDVMGDGAFLLGQGRFAFEIAPTAGPDGTAQILSRNAGIAPYTPVPSNNFGTRRLASALSPDAPYFIHYGKSPVSFAPWPWKWLPRWLGGIYPSAYRQAGAVQGFVR